jgi:hypothetical protein
MSDHSLMNPAFLKKELADTTELLAETETFARELEIDIDRAMTYFVNAPRTEENLTLTSEEANEIVQLLARMNLYKYRLTSPRKVAVSQYTQLLKDRRYAIASKLLNLFK